MQEAPVDRAVTVRERDPVLQLIEQESLEIPGAIWGSILGLCQE